jgi:hypothetical protein
MKKSLKQIWHSFKGMVILSGIIVLLVGGYVLFERPINAWILERGKTIECQKGGFERAELVDGIWECSKYKKVW